MKKIIGGLLIGVVLLGACQDSNVGASSGRDDQVKGKKYLGEYNEMKVLIDEETECEYLYNINNGGMTIRLDEYGKPKGCKKISKQESN
ncbi:DUF6440 family protein [Bacillus cereus]|uniref:DUF6440 family protein n=1 Tax=Bacillus cereus TaxID=1396 RepID=UPI001B8C73B6|nr:DUF6440 family protein [Bacillus cereus]QUW39847.1 hypothetical protein J8Y18_27490 [Bacillus cereus]